MKNRDKRQSKFGRQRKEVKQNTIDLSTRTYRKRYEENSKLKLIIIVVFLGLILTTIIIYTSQSEDLKAIEAEKQAILEDEQRIKERKIRLGNLYLSYKKLEKAGDQAFEEKRYFESVYQYKQASLYNENSIRIYEKLHQALTKSCENGNDSHCRKMEEVNETIVAIKRDTTLESLEDKRDSMLFEISSLGNR